MSDLKPGYVINNRYRVVAIIGQGGMGTVVKAIMTETGKEVAVKLCHIADPAAVKRFAREIRLMRKIKHRHVVPILRVGIKHSPPYFVMPLAQGSCSSRVAAYTKDEASAIKDFLEICEGVQAIHGAGGVHRDIKPDNALILAGRVVLSDLGLAKLAARDTTILTQTRAIVGTDMYLAPEQRFVGGSRDADARTDIYQLGKTLYQMVTGLEPALIDASKVPPGLAHVIRRATKEQPDERYQSVGQLIDAVNAYVRAKDPSANPMAAFEAALSRVKDRLEREEYREEDLQELLDVLANQKVQSENEQFLELFDSIPIRILRVMAELLGASFEPVLEHYVKVVDEEARERAFEYAETVAKKMRAIFAAPDAHASLKAIAVEATLVAAVRLNRFAAMEVLADMLTAVKADDLAAAVYDALDRRRRDYSWVCDQVPSLKLHPQIRALRDELAKKKADNE
jgi:eukaryotic-like serine/threonine-protein kinase